MLFRSFVHVLAALACALVITSAHAGWTSLGKVNASPALLNEKFGCSIAIDGEWMAVGASDSTVGQARSTGARDRRAVRVNGASRDGG